MFTKDSGRSLQSRNRRSPAGSSAIQPTAGSASQPGGRTLQGFYFTDRPRLSLSFRRYSTLRRRLSPRSSAKSVMPHAPKITVMIIGCTI